MKLQFFAVLAMAALAVAQGVTDKIAPTGDPPAGCEPSFDGMFEITIVPLADKAKKDSALEVRQLSTPSNLTDMLVAAPGPHRSGNPALGMPAPGNQSAGSTSHPR
jgi:hypothetical protein